MRNAKNLVGPRKILQFLANRLGSATAYAGINFIKDQSPLATRVFLTIALGRSGFHARFQSQHGAREFPARSSLLKRPEGFAGIRRNQADHLIDTGKAPVRLLFRSPYFDPE